jgi:DNA-binding transcriptional ArsR family regulator
LPRADTPGVLHPAPDVSVRDSAEAAWRSVVPSIAGTPHIRLSFDGGRTYPARHARRLPEVPPEAHPSVVPVYNPGAATGRMLALDLDPARGDVDGQAAELGQLLARLSARYVADVAPSGGRHVYVLFSSSLPWRELRDLIRALALRFPAIDPAPMCALGGQISPPGSRHKSGGWRTLTTPLSQARAAVEHPNGPGVWSALLTEFAAELQHAETGSTVEPVSAELDDGGVPWMPRLGGRVNLGPELDRTARTGRWDRSRHADRSAARMAVLASAAARGWQLTDVRSAVGSGAWQGLARLYERPSEPGRMERLLEYEFRKAVAFVTREKNVRQWHTSDLSTRPPIGQHGGTCGKPVDNGFSTQYGLIRQWMTATDCAVQDPGRVKGWGTRAIAVRLVLLALGQAAMVSGSGVLEFGCRNLALHSALSHRTVSRVLRLLADEDDPLIDLVSPRRLARADRYALRIPAAYADSVRWRRRRAGRIEAAHPAFLVLGGTAALVHQVLGADPASGAEVARAARLSPSAVSAALRVLAEHGLAERGPGGWRRGPANLDDVAESTGAADLHREREERYKRDRESWRARLAQYASARSAAVAPGDGWLSLDDDQEWDAMLFGRWPVLRGDFVRGPPSADVRDSA